MKETMAEKNPRVFMDVSIHKWRALKRITIPVGSLIFELFPKVAPNAAENFRALCTGERGIGKINGCPLFYGGSTFYDTWVGSSLHVKGGVLDDKCGESIYGGDVPDERPTLECNERGLLAMNMFDWYAIGSHFTITMEPDERLNRFHIVFGKLVDGWETLVAISKALGSPTIEVTACGVLNEDGSRSYGRPLRKHRKKAKMFNADGSRRSRHPQREKAEKDKVCDEDEGISPHRRKAKKAMMCDEDDSNNADRPHRKKAKKSKMCDEDDSNNADHSHRKKAKKSKMCDEGEIKSFLRSHSKEAEKAKMCEEDESTSSGHPHRKRAEKRRDWMCDVKLSRSFLRPHRKKAKIGCDEDESKF